MPEAAPVTTTLLLHRLHDMLDNDAWNQFDSRFSGVIFATALRLGLSTSDAEDATQETMFQAIRDYKAGRYDKSRGRLSSWIITIAHHRIVDVQRARRSQSDGSAGVNPEGTGGSVGIGGPWGARDAIDAAPERVIRVEEVTDAFEMAIERHIFEEAWRSVREDGKTAAATLAAFELTAMRGVPPAAAAVECGMTVDQVYVARNRVSKRLQECADRIGQAVRDGL